MRAWIIATALAVATGTAAEAAAWTVEGRAAVTDGDTVVVDGVKVRLKGVDAPEQSASYGPDATKGMRAIVGDWLKCELTGEKTHNREVGYCINAAGQDIGEAIIKKGLALACPFYSRRYIPFEQPEAIARLPRASYCRDKTAESSPDCNNRNRPRPPGIICMFPDDLDSAGRRCGKRAACERPGGY
jgi:micrococcal nuclease